MRKSHNHTLSRHCYDYPQPRIIFSRLTHRITQKNSAYWQSKTSGFFSCTRLIQVPGCKVTRTADQHRARFHSRKKTCLGPGQSTPAILLSPNSFDSLEPVHEVKDLVVTLEKRTISYLSVSARIRVIDPFSQMKRKYIPLISRVFGPYCTLTKKRGSVIYSTDRKNEANKILYGFFQFRGPETSAGRAI